MDNKQGERIQDQVVNAVEQVGAKITEFFSGNPLETDVGRMIVAATNADVIKGEDWGLIMAICDHIIEVPNGPRDALRAIKKQLADNINKNPQTIIYTLVVLEAAVKNCGAGFASLVCKTEFLDELIKIVKKDTPPQVQEKVLALIQSWADAFRGIPECSEVAQYYDDLKKRGIEFPATDLDSLAPIITPKRTVFSNSVEPPSDGGRSSQPGVYVAAGQPQPVIDDASIAKIQGELCQAKNHAQSFLDLLNKLPPVLDITEPDIREKLQKIYETTKKMRDRTAILVQHVYENQTLVTEILDCNDLLTNAINIYENSLNPKEREPCDPSVPGPSMAKPTQQSSGLAFEQTDAPLNVAAFNKTEPITDRVTEQVENWLLTDKKEPEDKSEEKKDDGL